MILQTHGLSRTFAGFTAVRDVALAVREGSIHGIIGPNGAGKTTLFNLLSGFLAPTSGTIAFRGRDIDPAQCGGRRARRHRAQFPNHQYLRALVGARQRPRFA